MTDSQRALSGSVILGRYRVVRELARGGMGMVYLGRVEGAAGFSKPVVIKRVLSHMDEEPSARQQFAREARLLSELHHPGIVGVVDFGQERDSYLMVLEYVHGYNLGHWLKYARETRGQLEWEFAVFAMMHVLSALHYAHTRVGPDGRVRPIIHRDVSPGNVLVDLQGNVRLLDFGIARSEEPDEYKTQEGIVKGKLPYIAPEMYQAAEASVASDVYAAGVSLYQLLSGKNPFSAKDMSAIVTRVLTYEPPPISAVRSDVPAKLDAVLARSLKKKPAERYASAQEFAHALASLFARPESEIAGEFRTAAARDFSSDMPERLQLPALATLDAAWRESSPDPTSEQSLLSSSRPPLGGDLTTKFTLPDDSGLSDKTVQELTTGKKDLAQRQRELTQAERSGTYAMAQQLEDRSASAQLAGAGNRRTLVLTMFGAALVAGGVAFAVLVLGRTTSPAASTGQRYLVVERQKSEEPLPAEPAPASEPAPAAAPTPAVSDDTKEDPVPSDEPAPTPSRVNAASRPASDAERLTSAFAGQQGAVQACFSQNADGLEGSPQISVHFKVAGQGSIQAATLSPAALGSTALGKCVLGVAKKTRFPALGKDVSFSIPITARVVKK